MAAGVLIASADVPAAPFPWVDKLDRRWTPGAHDSALATAGLVASIPVPAVTTRAAATGTRLASFNDDWFDTFHVMPRSFALGLLATAQERSFTIWNSYATTRALDELTFEGADSGLSIVTSPPATFARWEERVVTFAAAADGDPTVDAEIVINFDSGGEARIAITATRVELLVVEPDWSQPLVERRGWLTDVERSRDGSETRTALRDAPRRSWRYRIVRTGAAARRLDADTWGWGGRVPLGLPVWTDVQRLTAALALGATSIPCDTAERDFRAGSLVVLSSGSTHEALVIDTVGESSLALAGPTLNAWPVGTRLAPVRLGRVTGLGRGYRTAGLLEGELALELTDLEEDVAGAASATQYRGLDLDTTRPDWTNGIETDAARVIERVDGSTGVWVADEQLGRPVASRTLEHAATTRTGVRSLLAWLGHLQGRATAFWQSTRRADLVLAADVTVGATTLQIEAVGYATRYAQRQGRRHLALYHRPTRTLIPLRILSASDPVAGVETLTLDPVDIPTGIQQAGAAGDWLVSWLELVRLDADDIEVSWLTPNIARVALPVRELVVVET